MKYAYATLCVLGVLLPYGALLPWLLDNGLSIGAFVSDAGATSISAMAWLDVMVSAVALLFFIFAESRRLGMSTWWAPAVGTFLVGVSLGLPLFLLLRELQFERQKP